MYRERDSRRSHGRFSFPPTPSDFLQDPQTALLQHRKSIPSLPYHSVSLRPSFAGFDTHAYL